MSDIFSLIAAEEGDSNSSEPSIIQPVGSGSATSGKVVQRLQDNTVADLPLRNYGYDSFTLNGTIQQTTSSTTTSPSSYTTDGVTMYPTNNADVWLLNASAGSSDYNTIRLIKLAADGVSMPTILGSVSIGAKSSYPVIRKLGTSGTVDTFLYMCWQSSTQVVLAVITVDTAAGTITIGTGVNVTIYTANSNNTCFDVFDSTSAVLITQDSTGLKVQAQVVSISGTTISLGTAVVLYTLGAASALTDLDVVVTSTNKALVRAYGKYFIITRSAATISYGGTSYTLVNSTANGYGGITSATYYNGSNNSFIYETYREVLGSDYVMFIRLDAGTQRPQLRVVNAGGSTVASEIVTDLFSGAATNGSSATGRIAVVDIGSGRRLITYKPYGGPGIYSTVVSISGTSVSVVGTTQLIFPLPNVEPSNGHSVALLSDGTILVHNGWENGGSNGPTVARFKINADYTLAYQNSFSWQITPGNVSSIPIVERSDGTLWFFLAGRDTNKISSYTSSSGYYSAGVCSRHMSSFDIGQIAGILTPTNEVVTHGVAKNVGTALPFGIDLYYDLNGAITPWPTNNTALGKAINATDIWVNNSLI